MNWTELHACLRTARWLLLLGGFAGCSGPRDGAPRTIASAAYVAAETVPSHTPGEAAAEKAEVTRALGEQWASLAAVLPDEAAAVRDRLHTPPGRQSRAGKDVDLDAARIGLRRCESLWSKAQAAFAAGNMNEAVGTAITVKAQLDALATTLRVETAARGS